MTEDNKEWRVEFAFEDDESADMDLLGEITAYKDMWVSCITVIGNSIHMTVESASGHAEYDIRRIAEHYSYLVYCTPDEVIY